MITIILNMWSNDETSLALFNFLNEHEFEYSLYRPKNKPSNEVIIPYLTIMDKKSSKCYYKLDTALAALNELLEGEEK